MSDPVSTTQFVPSFRSQSSPQSFRSPHQPRSRSISVPLSPPPSPPTKLKKNTQEPSFWSRVLCRQNTPIVVAWQPQINTQTHQHQTRAHRASDLGTSDLGTSDLGTSHQQTNLSQLSPSSRLAYLKRRCVRRCGAVHDGAPDVPHTLAAVCFGAEVCRPALL